ncbi:MAG: c-type cytochrome domain-containing protein, partial [Flavobacteriaceae bacterium]
MEIWLEYIGRFHPIVLHLPIGALLFSYLIALLGLKEYESFRKTLLLGIIFSFVSALIASLLGLLLYNYGDYDKVSIQNHMILGWITTFSIAILWAAFEKVHYKSVFIPLFTFSIITLSLTGHFGGQITHGETYLVLPSPQEEVMTVRRDSIQIYQQAVAKIFNKKCVSCHNFSKRKGGLALHTPEAIAAGGENGAPYLIGNSEKSKIIQYSSLPLEDKMHMPPKGRPQLTPSEIKVFAYWINQGATFDQHLNLTSLPVEVKKSFEQFLPEELPKVNPLNFKVLIDLKNNGFRVTRYIADKPFVQVKFEGEKLTEKEVSSLVNAAEHIVELEISGYELPSLFWEEIDQFKNLYKIRLDRTNTQDKQLEKLVELPLRSLNISQTQ